MRGAAAGGTAGKLQQRSPALPQNSISDNCFSISDNCFACGFQEQAILEHAPTEPDDVDLRSDSDSNDDDAPDDAEVFACFN